jgi:hypothetical protein
MLRLSERARELSSQLFELAGHLNDVAGHFANEASADQESRNEFRRAVIDVQRAYDRLSETELVRDTHRDSADQRYGKLAVPTWVKK